MEFIPSFHVSGGSFVEFYIGQKQKNYHFQGGQLFYIIFFGDSSSFIVDEVKVKSILVS